MKFKICRDCKFCGWNDATATGYMGVESVFCSRIRPTILVDLVGGTRMKVWNLYCHSERKNKNGCGPEGRYFQLYVKNKVA